MRISDQRRNGRRALCVVCYLSAAAFVTADTLPLPQAYTQFARSFVKSFFLEGFFDGQNDLKDAAEACVRDVRLTTADAIDSIKDLATGDIQTFFKCIEELFRLLREDTVECLLDVQAIDNGTANLRHVKSVHDILDLLRANLFNSGPKAIRGLAQSAALCKDGFYDDCGSKAGEAMHFILIGETPPLLEPPYNIRMTTVSWSTAKRADPSEQFDVFWNLSPLYMEKFRDWMTFPKLFHTSVGFFNKHTHLNTTIEFIANNFDRRLVLPTPNFTDRSLAWDTAARWLVKEGSLDTNYWPFRTRIATINGSTYNSIMTLGEANWSQTFTNYFLFQLDTSPSGVDDGRGSGDFTCVNAAETVVDAILQLAGPCAFDQSSNNPGILKVGFFLLGTGKPEITDSQSDANEIFQFYASAGGITGLWSGEVIKTLREMVRLAQGTNWGKTMLYHDRHLQYWAFRPRFPIVTFRSNYKPLPADPKKCFTRESMLVV